ncbi:hypothetical protein JTE90_002560 [Oedothorax gibbosus]|uniref:Uncharacterized protein n=1 Tax=Oedothorax gibbosus TaxID=931172 RepID=A0AAV6V0V0_9ARAC|nr:hypothetical protein JTE90_002560 [Oedothorax gibbosus]
MHPHPLNIHCHGIVHCLPEVRQGKRKITGSGCVPNIPRIGTQHSLCRRSEFFSLSHTYRLVGVNHKKKSPIIGLRGFSQDILTEVTLQGPSSKQRKLIHVEAGGIQYQKRVSLDVELPERMRSIVLE